MKKYSEPARYLLLQDRIKDTREYIIEMDIEIELLKAYKENLHQKDFHNTHNIYTYDSAIVINGVCSDDKTLAEEIDKTISINEEKIKIEIIKLNKLKELREIEKNKKDIAVYNKAPETL